VIKYIHWSSCKVTVILCQILTKFEICRQIFEKYRNVKFLENLLIGDRNALCGGTDRLQTDRQIYMK
jgi:hypothetical protein